MYYSPRSRVVLSRDSLLHRGEQQTQLGLTEAVAKVREICARRVAEVAEVAAAQRASLNEQLFVVSEALEEVSQPCDCHLINRVILIRLLCDCHLSNHAIAI